MLIIRCGGFSRSESLVVTAQLGQLGANLQPHHLSTPTTSIMEEGNPLAALATTGSVGSRFVTQSEIDSAKERREADWKAAYAR